MQLAPSPTRTLADATSAALMVAKFKGRSMPDVMCELSQALHAEDGSLPDLHQLALQALNCELLTSMRLDLGAAFPHLNVAALSRSRFALGRAPAPLSWRAAVFPPIDLVILIIEPSKADLESWQLVNTLHQLGMNRSRLDDLRRAATTEEMLAILAQIPLVAVSTLPPLPRVSDADHNRAGTSSGFHRRWRH